MYSPQPGLVQCPFTSYSWPLGNSTSANPKPPCPDAPLPDLAALQGPNSAGSKPGGSNSNSGGGSAGAIAGIAVGVVAAVAAAAAVGFVLLRRRRKRAAAKAAREGAPRDEFIDMSGAAGSKGLSDSRDALEDPLLSYINTHLKSWASLASSGGASQLSRPSTISQRSSGGVDVAPWVSVRQSVGV